MKEGNPMDAPELTVEQLAEIRERNRVEAERGYVVVKAPPGSPSVVPTPEEGKTP